MLRSYDPDPLIKAKFFLFVTRLNGWKTTCWSRSQSWRVKHNRSQFVNLNSSHSLCASLAVLQNSRDIAVMILTKFIVDAMEERLCKQRVKCAIKYCISWGKLKVYLFGRWKKIELIKIASEAEEENCEENFRCLFKKWRKQEESKKKAKWDGKVI